MLWNYQNCEVSFSVQYIHVHNARVENAGNQWTRALLTVQ